MAPREPQQAEMRRAQLDTISRLGKRHHELAGVVPPDSILQEELGSLPVDSSKRVTSLSGIDNKGRLRADLTDVGASCAVVLTTSRIDSRASDPWSRLTSTFGHAKDQLAAVAKMFAQNSVQSQNGPDLEEIQTEEIGFLALAGEAKLRIVPQPWPQDSLPPPTASLLSVASRRGLIAAAGPDTLVVGSTNSIRETLIKSGPSENNIKIFSPQLSIHIPRVTQLAFSSDENFLTICAESGGGLATYDVQTLVNGGTNPSHQLATNGIAVRALAPNPAEETAHVLALVLTNGQLMLADLKEKQFINARNGPIFCESVSCISWSARGKQLVAGLENGTSVQLKPDGSVAAEIPKPSDLQGEQHVSTIFWINNDAFLLVHTASNFSLDHAPDSTFTLATRIKNSPGFVFRKFPDPCPPFGMNRSPPHHFVSRLRNFPPFLTEALILASTASADIGLLTSSSMALSKDSDPAKVIDHLTTTSMANETRRAQLPVNEEMNDTSPIGMALDLSSTELVRHPIPGDELEETKTPLPALMVLNNEGILSSWWFVFSESVRKGLAYPGLNVATSNQTTQHQPSAQPSFAQNSQVENTRFGAPAQPLFGTPSAPAFGAPSALGSNITTSAKPSPWGGSSSAGAVFGSSSFGSPSQLGQSRPSGATPSQGSSQGAESFFSRPAFGQPAFASSTPLGGAPGFGSPGNVGNRGSPWTTQAATTQSSLFGQQEKPANPFAGGSTTTSPFANLSSTSMESSSAFQNSAPPASFASLSQQALPQPNLFGSAPSSTGPKSISQPSFGSTVTIGSSLGVTSSFGAPSTSDSKSPWLTPGASSKGDEHFGSNFPKIPASPAADMAMTNDDDEPSQVAEDTPARQRGQAGAPPLFGKPSFKFESTSKVDEGSTNDQPESDGKSLFGSTFGDALTFKSTNVSAPAKEDQARERQTSMPQPRLIASAGSSSSPQPAPEGVSATPLKSNNMNETNSKTLASEVTPVQPTVQSGAKRADPELRNLFTSSTPKVLEKDISSSPIAGIPEPPLPPSPTLSPVAPHSQASGPQSDKINVSPVSKPEAPSELPAGTTNKSKQDQIAEAPLPPDFITYPSSTPQWNIPPLNATSASTTPKAALPALNDVNDDSQTPIDSKKPSVALGNIEPPTLFPRPGNIQQSPRSPSPTRRINSLRSPSPRFGQAAPNNQFPGKSSRSTFNSNQVVAVNLASGRPSYRPATRSFTQPASIPLNLNPEVEIHPAFEAAEDTTDEYRLIQTELSAPVESSRKLEPFLAYQDYVGQIAGQGIPTQIERVYRDICSMIDTLGLNARSLKAWTKGQQELIPDGGRERKDLTNEDDWCLTEVEDLAVIEKGIEEQLEADRMSDVDTKISELSDIHKDLLRQHAKYNEVKRLVQRRGDNRDNATEPLSIEQSGIVVDLRNECAQLFTRLAKAEDAISLLRVRISSRQAETLRGIQSVKTPTVEAVLGTINKMTAMFEKRNTDIDVLDSQLRKLGVHAANTHMSPRNKLSEINGRPNNSSFATPEKGFYTLDYSSDSENGIPFRRRIHGSNTPDRNANTVFQSPLTSSQRGKQSQTDIEVYQQAQRRRQKVLNIVKDKVTEKGVRTTKVQ